VQLLNIARNPDFSEAHNNLGVALGDGHDVTGAIAEFRAALQINPYYFEAHNNLANSLRGQHDLEGAIAEYREALNLRPDDTDLRSNLRLTLQEQQVPQESPGSNRN
jgi:Flp pilus assembly protein TadD